MVLAVRVFACDIEAGSAMVGSLGNALAAPPQGLEENVELVTAGR
jgi:hypothetical protein